ncbi:MAG TPA: hypothetical protein VFK88_08065 [Gallionella sp.]|nr:hypothetical protein [Gallionella sp.]
MKNVLWFFALAVVLTGCASTTPIQDEERSKLKKVGIVSLIGEEFRFTKVGLTLFNNDEFSKNVSGWQLDKMVVQSAVETLKNAEPPMRPVVLPVDHSLLGKLYRQKGEFGSYVNVNRIEDDLRALVKKHPVDALVLIHSEQVQDPIQGTCIYLYGSGLYYRSLPFDEPYIKPYSFLRIVVLDGKTLKPLSQKLVNGISKDYGKMQMSWEDDIKHNFTDKQWIKLQAEVRHLIKANVVSSLQEIGL